MLFDTGGIETEPEVKPQNLKKKQISEENEEWGDQYSQT